MDVAAQTPQRTSFIVRSYYLVSTLYLLVVARSTLLSEQEAARRQAQYGPNTLQERPEPSFSQSLVQQFTSFLVLLLMVTAIVSFIFVPASNTRQTAH